MTTREAADRLGVTINAIKAWIRDEQLPALRTPGGHHRIADADLTAFQAKLAQRTHDSTPSHPRVLIVDDDEALLAALAEALEQVLPEAQVAIASDGYEALLQVGATRPDILVLDVRMPRLDGFEVCRRLKTRRDTSGIRILAMTAYPEAHVRERIMEAGADDFLEKPFAIERFRSRVMALASRRA